MGNKAKTARQLNLPGYIAGAIVLLIILIGAWLSFQTRKHEDENIRRELLRQASSIASTLSLESVRELSFRAEDAEQPAFQRITRQLQTYAQTAGIRSLYTMSLRDDQLFFGPDGLPPDDPYATPPGTLHQQPSPDDFEAFRTAKYVVYGPHTDQFGEFITAIIPIVDPLSGTVIMAVGVDMEASIWRKQMHKATWMPIVAVLSPLFLLLLGYFVQKNYKKSAHLRMESLRNIQVTTYFAVMLLLAVIAFAGVRSIENKNQQALFSAEANAKAQYYTQSVKQVDFVLHLLSGFFESSENITREEFSAFCQRILEENPIQACFWLPALSSTNAPKFTAQIQKEGFPDFSIRRFANDNRPNQNPADPIYPAVYVEPVSRLPAALGYDFYSHPVLREVLLDTLRSGLASACIVSAPTPNSSEPTGLFVFVPISHALQEGFIGISIDLAAFIEISSLSGKIEALSASLFELQASEGPQPLTCTTCVTCPASSACAVCLDMFKTDQIARAPIFAFGKTFMMLFTAEPQWFAEHPRTMSWLTLGIGLALSLLLTYTAALLINRPLLLAKQVSARTRELAEAKERFDIAISAAKMGIWEHDLQRDRLIWGDRMLEVYGIQQAEFTGKPKDWHKYIHPKDKDRFDRALAAAKRGEKDLDIEVRITRSTGEIRHILAYGKTIYEENQTPARIIGVNLDITEQKRQEDALLASEEMMRSSQSVAHICSYSTLLDGNEIEESQWVCSPEFYKIFGIDETYPHTIAGWAGFIHPNFRDEMVAYHEAVVKERKTFNKEYKIIRIDDGSERWVHGTGKLEFDEKGTPIRMHGAIQDITEQKRSQQKLEESRQLLCNIIDSLPERVWWKDLDSRYLGCNIQVAHDAGFDHPDQMIGKTDFDLCWAIHAETFIASDREIIESGIPRIFDPELQVMEDGSTRWIEVSIIPLKDTLGKVFGVLGSYSDITDRMRADERLKASEEQFRSALNDLQVGVIVHDPDSSIVLSNPQARNILGLSADQLIGKKAGNTAWRFVREDLSEMPVHDYPVSQVIATGEKVINQVLGIKKPDCKEITWVLVSAVPVMSGQNKMARIIINFMDITESRRSQTLMKNSEARLQRAQKVAQVGNWEFDLETRLISASDEAVRIYGMDGRQWTISEVQQIALRKDRGMLNRALETLITQGTSYDVEFTIKRPSDGALREIHSVAEYDPEKKQVFGVIQDITVRKQAEHALALSEAKYRDLFEQSADAFLIIKDGRFIDCNQAAVEMMRLNNKKELLNAHPADLSPERQPDGKLSIEKADELIQSMLEQKSIRFEWLHKRANGEVFPVDVSLTTIADSEGTHIIHTTWRDLTERKRAEEQLIRLSTAIEQSPESIVITDPHGDIQYVNPAFENNTGYTADEAIGQNPRILNSGEHPPSFYEEMWEILLRGETWEGRITNKRKDGTFYTEEATISPVRNAEGQTVNYVAVKRDISGEMAREEELRQSQKMEAVGELAGGVAHDFNNILQGIIGFSELLRYSLDETSQEYSNAYEIHKAATRAAKLTQQLLTFSRKQAIRLEEIELNNVVYDSEALLQVLLGSSYEVVLDLKDELPLVYADQGQLTQIIMNLSVNARDAMPEGGRLTISTDCILIEEADAAFIAGASPGRHLCLAVTDTGSGMDAGTISRIFEPFFTTKEIGSGTGLGLAVIYGIVTQNKGWINVYSEIGKGSCFKVYLPIATSNEGPADGDPATVTQGRKGRILLIDDDPKILNMVKKILGKADLTIIAAGSAEEGLALFDQSADGFDLLMSDMELPGMRGDELAEALRKKNPELPVLLFSGYRDHATRWRSFADKGYLFLNKPFTITVLLDTVRSILEDTKGAHG